jgi:hypothetical protein
LAIAFEVERDVREPGLLERLRDGGGHFRGERAGHFFGRDFDAREFVVKADAELLKAEIAKGGFAALDKAEALGSYFCAVGHAGSEAGGGGAIPGGKSGALREMADFGFAQAGVEKRGEYAMPLGGAMAGAEIEGVVGVNAVGGGGETALPGEGVKDREKLVFTEEAAVGGIGAVCGIFHLAGFNECVMDAGGADEFFYGGPIVSGEAGRKCGDGQSVLAEDALRGPREVSRIGATGKGDNQRCVFSQAREENGFFLLGRGTGGFSGADWNERGHSKSSITQSLMARRRRRFCLKFHLKSSRTCTVSLASSGWSQWPTSS